MVTRERLESLTGKHNLTKDEIDLIMNHQSSFKEFEGFLKIKSVDKLLELVGRHSPEEEMLRVSTWLGAVVKHENVSNSAIYTVNKEKICDEAKSFISEGVRGILLPNGEIVNPLRDYCEIKTLPPGIREAFFYSYGDVVFTETNVVPAPVLPTPRGTKIKVTYKTVEEETAVAVVQATNKSYSLETLKDENRQILHDVTEVAPKHWVDNKGVIISEDSHELSPLRLQGVFSAINKIASEGLDTSNLILAVNGIGINHLLEDPFFDEQWRIRIDAKLVEHNIENLSKLLGVRIVRSNCYKYTMHTKSGRLRKLFGLDKSIEIAHAVLFLPNITFGLVTSRDMTMEMQRKNETEQIIITGTNRLQVILKNKESMVRISYENTIVK